MKNIEVETIEAREVFLLLEKLNSFLHNENNYQSQEDFKNFAKKIYPEIRKAYWTSGGECSKTYGLKAKISKIMM